MNSSSCDAVDSWDCDLFVTTTFIARITVCIVCLLACAYIIIVSLTFKFTDLFKIYTLNLYIPFVPFNTSQLIYVIYAYSNQYALWDKSLYSPFVLCVRYFRFLISAEYKVLVNSLMFIIFICYTFPIKYQVYFKERVCGFLFLCGHVFANLLAVCSVVCVSQLWPVNPNGELMNNAVKFIYYFVQVVEVILNILTSVSFLMTLVAIFGHNHPKSKESDANRKRLISLIVYSTPPAVMNLISIVSCIGECLETFAFTGFINSWFYPMYMFAKRWEDRFIDCRSIVLTICTIFAFKQYRDATVSILRCSNKTKQSPCKPQTIITKPALRRSTKLKALRRAKNSPTGRVANVGRTMCERVKGWNDGHFDGSYMKPGGFTSCLQMKEYSKFIEQNPIILRLSYYTLIFQHIYSIQLKSSDQLHQLYKQLYMQILYSAFILFGQWNMHYDQLKMHVNVPSAFRRTTFSKVDN